MLFWLDVTYVVNTQVFNDYLLHLLLKKHFLLLLLLLAKNIFHDIFINLFQHVSALNLHRLIHITTLISPLSFTQMFWLLTFAWTAYAFVWNLARKIWELFCNFMSNCTFNRLHQGIFGPFSPCSSLSGLILFILFWGFWGNKFNLKPGLFLSGCRGCSQFLITTLTSLSFLTSLHYYFLFYSTNW